LALIGGLLTPVTLNHVLTGTLRLSLVSPRVTLRTLTAGLVVLDVADTAASWFGSQFGHVLWRHVLSTRACAPLAPHRKSLAGTCAALLATLLADHVLTALVAHDHVLSWSHVRESTHVLVPALFAVLCEALTTQIDNLVLPLLYWTLLVASSP
jgi:dolichol kinase